MEFLLLLLVLFAVVALVLRPLSHPRAAEARESAEEADLRAARDAKYQEIRDLELDFRTGKLSREDYREQDGALRAEAIAMLRRLDELEATAGPRTEGGRLDPSA